MTIAIAGYGIEGRANYAYWSAKGADITILDERPLVDMPDNTSVITGENAFAALEQYDMVIRTASLRPEKLATARKIWSATNEFFAECPAPIIGVTGTKGKGTTASLITAIFRAAGKTVHLVGNIGVPALDILPGIGSDDLVVYEMSSFQLWDLQKSPHIGVVLMIEPDHLDIHTGMDEYIMAKTHIASAQTMNDIVVYHPNNEYSRTIALLSAGRKVRYGTMQDGGVYVNSNNFCIQSDPICSVSALHIAGGHNLENACAAITAALMYDARLDYGDIARGLNSFNGLPHRLKFVRKVGGVKYYDDSIATTPGSAMAALRSFEEPKVIILGGSDKGASYQEIVALCQQTATAIVAIGTTGETIMQLAHEVGVTARRIIGPMDEAVEAASELAQVGGVVILSPASASFDQYSSYAERGDRFITAVEGLV